MKTKKKKKISKNDNEISVSKYNSVSVGDFVVQSSTASLNKCVRELKVLIKDFSEFHSTRIANKLKMGWGGVG